MIGLGLILLRILASCFVSIANTKAVRTNGVDQIVTFLTTAVALLKSLTAEALEPLHSGLKQSLMVVTSYI